MNRFKYSEKEERSKVSFCGYCGKAECKEKHEIRPVTAERRYFNPLSAVDINGRAIPQPRRSSVTISG